MVFVWILFLSFALGTLMALGGVTQYFWDKSKVEGIFCLMIGIPLWFAMNGGGLIALGALQE